jgi:hypothetical protein
MAKDRISRRARLERERYQKLKPTELEAKNRRRRERAALARQKKEAAAAAAVAAPQYPTEETSDIKMEDGTPSVVVIGKGDDEMVSV